MNTNALKIIACVSMFIDHLGFIVFPKLLILRIIGRLAMPIFSFFIGIGCVHTSSKKNYLFRVLGLGLVCQLIVSAELFFNHNVSSLDLNILFTFSISIVLCWLFLNVKSSFKTDSFKLKLINTLVFLASLTAVIYLFTRPLIIFGIEISVDYSLGGIILPLFVVFFPSKTARMISFTVGLILFNILLFKDVWFIWFSLLSLPCLIFYNSQKGKNNLKNLFYFFYPAHFAIIYFIKAALEIINL